MIVGELIAIKIKENKLIKGIQISNEVTNILSQFTDDTALFLKYDKISLEETISMFEHIEANTGLQISYKKTIIYRLGSLYKTEAKLYTQQEMCWTNDDFVLLGITMSNEDNCTTVNYEEIIKKFENICQQGKL